MTIMNTTYLFAFRKSICLLLVILFTIIIYWQVGDHQFQTSWDDHWVVINMYTENGVAGHNLWRILSEFYNGQYAPVNQLYYSILYELFGYSSMAFHVSSLMVHLVNVYLTFVFFNLLIRRSKLMPQTEGERTALATCLIFAVHPLMVESVAWISASKILMYALFYLIGLVCYLNFLEKFKKRYFVLTVFAFVLSYSGKEQAVTFPLCLILIDFIVYKRKIPKELWIQKIPFLFISLLFGYIAIASQSANGQGLLSNNTQYPIYQRLVFCVYCIFEYLAKCLVPVKLSYIYPFPNQIGEPLPLKLFVYPVILIVIIVSLWKCFKYRWLFLGASFFLVHLIPIVHIIPIARFVIIADRYIYMSSLGLFFLIAYLLNYSIRRYKRYQNVILFMFIIYISCLACYSYRRIEVWHDSDSLKKEIRQIIINRGIKLYQRD